MLTEDTISQGEIKCVYSVSSHMLNNYYLHCHNHYEIYYLLEGDISYLAEGTCYQPLPGSLLLFPPHLFHGMKILSERPYRRYTVFFYDTALPAELRSFLLAVFPSATELMTKPLYFPNASALKLEPLFAYMQDCQKLESSYQDAMSRVYLQALLGRLALLSPGPAAVPSPEPDQRIAEILKYINDHLAEPLSLDQLSGQFFISKNYLNVLFREATGTTVGDYLINKRVIRAQQLLFDGYRASDAAAMSGFSDYSAFFRAYEKILGHRPSQDKGSFRVK